MKITCEHMGITCETHVIFMCFFRKGGDKPVLINNVPIPRTGTFTCLGVELDGKLKWDKHIDSICQKVSAGIGIVRRIKPYVPSKTLQDIYIID